MRIDGDPRPMGVVERKDKLQIVIVELRLVRVVVARVQVEEEFEHIPTAPDGGRGRRERFLIRDMRQQVEMGLVVEQSKFCRGIERARPRFLAGRNELSTFPQIERRRHSPSGFVPLSVDADLPGAERNQTIAMLRGLCLCLRTQLASASDSDSDKTDEQGGSKAPQGCPGPAGYVVSAHVGYPNPHHS